MDYREIEYFIFLFPIMSIAICVFFRNLAVGTIEETGTNSRLYPKHFIEPKRWIKKLFNIKDRVIPKYLYFELYLSLFFLILAPVSIAICIIFVFNYTVVHILVMFYMCLGLINVIVIIFMSFIFKKNKINKAK